MARFVYSMQNILNIKYKLEDQAKQHYMEVQGRMNDALAYKEELENRKLSYMEDYRILLDEKLDVQKIEETKHSIDLMDEYIINQQVVIDAIQKELDEAIRLMNIAMQERKIHEKLREKKYEEFLIELNREEMKEIDQLVSYTYNSKEEE